MSPFKKSNATRLWSIIFLLSWIFIHQVRYPWKACLFAFRLMPYLLGLFHWGACRVSKLGAMSKRKSCKIDWIEWEMHAMSSFGLFFCECMHAYPLPIHCTEILRKYWRILVQGIGSGTYMYACIQSMHSQNESPKLDIHVHVACISHLIQSILQLFLFDIAPNLHALHAPQWNNANKLGINRKANKQAFQGYQTWWIKIQDKRNIINQIRVALLFFEGWHSNCCNVQVHILHKSQVSKSTSIKWKSAEF